MRVQIFIVHIVFGTDIHVFDASLDIYHYFLGVDTLITHSWVMVVSSQISCIFFSVQYFLFLDTTSRSVGTRVVCISSGLCLFYFSAFILIYVLLRLELRLVGV